MASSSTKTKQNTKPKQQATNKISAELLDQVLTKISIHRGSITDLEVDCVVNAANGGLWAGAGVCGAIFRAAGYGALQRECDSITDKLGNIPTGESVLTKGYKLYANYIIHSVGPTSQNNQALQSCYITALELCIQHNIKSIAFPCISTGIFGFSKQVACPLALKTVKSWLIAAKQCKYKDYIKLIKEKQKLKIEEALKNKRNNRYRYGARDDTDDDDDDDWNDSEDDKGKMEQDNDKNDDDKNEVNKDEKKKQSVAKEEENQDEDKGVEEDNNNDNNDKNDNDDNENKKDEQEDEENEENEETVFDRIDEIIFCCFDVGNWRLYQSQTPKIFPSSQADYIYEWRHKLKMKEKKKAQQTKKKANYKESNGDAKNVDDAINSNNKSDVDMEIGDSGTSDHE